MLYEGWFQTGVCNKYKSAFIGVLCIKIPCILWNATFFVVFRTGYHLSHILSQINPVALASYFLRPILVFSLLLCLGLPSGLFS